MFSKFIFVTSVKKIVGRAVATFSNENLYAVLDQEQLPGWSTNGFKIPYAKKPLT